MEEPSTTGSGDSGVMNGTGKTGGGRREGRKGRQGVVRKEGRGVEVESIENMLYQSILDW